MNRLAVQSFSATEEKQPNVEPIDGNALLYHTQWPKASTVAQIAASFIKSVSREHQVYIIFDKYFPGSIKSHERQRSNRNAAPENQYDNRHSIAKLEYVDEKYRQEKQLISLICSTGQPDSMTMVDEGNTSFGHEEAAVNLVSYTLLLAEGENKQHIQVTGDDTDVFLLLVVFVGSTKSARKSP